MLGFQEKCTDLHKGYAYPKLEALGSLCRGAAAARRRGTLTPMSESLTIAIGIVGALTGVVSAVVAAFSARSAAATHQASLDESRRQEIERVSLLAADCQIHVDRIRSLVVECRVAYKAAEIFSGSGEHSGIALAIAEVERKGAKAQALAELSKVLTDPSVELAPAIKTIAGFSALVRLLRLALSDSNTRPTELSVLRYQGQLSEGRSLACPSGFKASGVDVRRCRPLRLTC